MLSGGGKIPVYRVFAGIANRLHIYHANVTVASISYVEQSAGQPAGDLTETRLFLKDLRAATLSKNNNASIQIG